MFDAVSTCNKVEASTKVDLHWAAGPLQFIVPLRVRPTMNTLLLTTISIIVATTYVAGFSNADLLTFKGLTASAQQRQNEVIAAKEKHNE
jgi:hypothetical protein